MPIMSALPLGLALYGTTSVQFGDGSTASRFTALGVATLGQESQAGVILLEPSSTEVLVGMEFLRKFEKSILMHRGFILLLDQQGVDKGLKVIADALEQQPPVPEPSEPGNPPRSAYLSDAELEAYFKPRPGDLSHGFAVGGL